MEYKYKKGTEEREIEEIVYKQLGVLENLTRLRNRLQEDNLITGEEAEILEHTQAIIIVDTLGLAVGINIQNRVQEIAEGLRELK